MDEAMRRELGERIRREMQARRMTRDELRDRLANFGVSLSTKTISNITTGAHVGREANLLAIAEVLEMDIGDLGDRPALEGDGLTEPSIDRLFREAEAAQAAYDRAVSKVVAAEARLDQISMTVFRKIAESQAVEMEVRRREQQLGRKLTADEIDSIDWYDRPTSAEVAETMATHAEMDPHELTRYEIALMERFGYGAPGVDLTQHSSHLDMAGARLKAERAAGRRPTKTLMDEVRAASHPDANPNIVTTLEAMAEQIWRLYDYGRAADYAAPRSIILADVVPILTLPANESAITAQDMAYWAQDWRTEYQQNGSVAVLRDMLRKRDELMARKGITVTPVPKFEGLHHPNSEYHRASEKMPPLPDDFELAAHDPGVPSQYEREIEAHDSIYDIDQDPGNR